MTAPRVCRNGRLKGRTAKRGRAGLVCFVKKNHGGVTVGIFLFRHNIIDSFKFRRATLTSRRLSSSSSKGGKAAHPWRRKRGNEFAATEGRLGAASLFPDIYLGHQRNTCNKTIAHPNLGQAPLVSWKHRFGVVSQAAGGFTGALDTRQDQVFQTQCY